MSVEKTDPGLIVAATCGDCGAGIHVAFLTSGRSVPLDRVPRSRASVDVVDGAIKLLDRRKPEEPTGPPMAYIPHWFNCRRKADA